MAAAHPFGAFVGCRFKRIGIAHFAHTVSRSVSRATSPCHARPCLASACVSLSAWPYACACTCVLRQTPLLATMWITLTWWGMTLSATGGSVQHRWYHNCSCTRNFVLKCMYHGFNNEVSIKCSPEGSTWLSFLGFRKFSLPFLYESIKTCYELWTLKLCILIKLLCILFRSDCKKCRGFQPSVVHL